MADGIDDLVAKTSKLAIEERVKKEDKDFYGLQGLNPDTVLYRVCRYDQDTDNDILCKAKRGSKEAERTVNQHINSGSRLASRFISSTVSRKVALQWAFYTKETTKDVKLRPNGPHPIIIIDLSKMKGMQELKDLINLTNNEVQEHFVKGKPQINRVKSSQEVLFQWRIPKKNFIKKRDGCRTSLVEENVFELWKNPPQPRLK